MDHNDHINNNNNMYMYLINIVTTPLSLKPEHTYNQLNIDSVYSRLELPLLGIEYRV